MDEAIQTRQGDIYKIKCTECKQFIIFGTQIDSEDPDGFIIGWDGNLKPRPISFCSEECKSKFNKRRTQ